MLHHSYLYHCFRICIMLPDLVLPRSLARKLRLQSFYSALFGTFQNIYASWPRISDCSCHLTSYCRGARLGSFACKASIARSLACSETFMPLDLVSLTVHVTCAVARSSAHFKTSVPLPLFMSCAVARFSAHFKTSMPPATVHALR